MYQGEVSSVMAEPMEVSSCSPEVTEDVMTTSSLSVVSEVVNYNEIALFLVSLVSIEFTLTVQDS